MLNIRGKIITFNIIVISVLLLISALLIYLYMEQNLLVNLDSQLKHFSEDFEIELFSSQSHITLPDSIHINAWKKEGPKGLEFGLYQLGGEKIAGSTAARFKEYSAFPKGFSEYNRDSKRIRILIEDFHSSRLQAYKLVATAPMEHIDHILKNLLILFVIFFPIGLLIAFFAMFIILHFSFKPLFAIIETARNITVGNLNTKFLISQSNDEVSLLGQVFNTMLQRLAASVKSQKRFIADASHEIRTPLAIIRSELEYSRRHSSDEAIRKSCTISLQEIERLTFLTSGLLTLSKADAGHINLTKELHNLTKLVKEVAHSLKKLFMAKHITISQDIEENVELLIDKEKMYHVLLNLLDNAIKFTPENGVIFLSLSRIETPQKMVQLIIKDSGPGIKQEEIPLLFNRFYRSDDLRNGNPGVGLGLSIVYNYITLIGGTVTVKSDYGNGASFMVTIPEANKYLYNVPLTNQ